MAGRLGVRLCTAACSPRALDELVGLALRRNPKRAQLLVSHVLGKHIPLPPGEVITAGRELGAAAAARLDEAPVVIGFAETATALGHLVADELAAECLHSTRRRVDGPTMVDFAEEHSHATDHLLLPEDPGLLARPGPIVLVDDEVSTGRTALNLITALQRRTPRRRYLLAVLVDVRGVAERAAFAARAAQLGTRIDVVASASGSILLPDNVIERAAWLRARSAPASPVLRGGGEIRLPVAWASARDGARHGFTPRHSEDLADGAAKIAVELSGHLAGDRVHVLGTEELMYAPLLLAARLAAPGREVHFSATSRSPVVALDEDGYPVRTALQFPAHDAPDDGPGPRFAYNLGALRGAPGPSDVVIVLDDCSAGPAVSAGDGLLARVAALGARVHPVVINSYRPAGWR